MTGAADNAADIDDLLCREFLDEGVETLQALDATLDGARNGHVPATDVLRDFRRMAVGIRGRAAGFGLGCVVAIAHRLDEYLKAAPAVLPPRVWEDLQLYLDLLLALFEGREDGTCDPAALVRALPRRLGFDPTDITPHDVEVLLVMARGAQTHFVERELQQCGYRVSVVPDTLQAFSMVVQTKPDMVIVSAVMPELDGIDLAIALASMPSTRNIPIAVITSLDPGDERLGLLPARIPVLHKGATFGDDLFKALDSLFLI